ncbi:MAG: helix-turn-helix domain-containing protein [Proteocatella sp.]
MNKKRQSQERPYKRDKKLLSKKVILAAVLGEENALREIIRYYEGYINQLASRELYDKYGNVYIYRDAVLKTELQNKLVMGILKFQVRR